ncbi:twin-arginine translocase subunit TatC [Ectothiorhodospira lacustris]|uniref:twin-arginine translocase subunit TatC n=1 Tax=Ectothiorhodospira lacustris TaxID=2899127 RepID=UPI001EE81F44|nr:twin-arginine translocase subunit TatC [Ectothiorhodospira lacustris]MCG5509054.1 twin-arginine translocase subunit TatC [Ectothiorhodospira lacustris]MCG5520845.1 twin-arginine translocase subunit TatC [Ectothiorhodospira lacustris]
MNHKPESPQAGDEAEGTLLSHLVELRTRLLRSVLAILLVFLVLFPFANPIYTFLAGPLMVHLPEGSSMIAIEVAAPFLIPFKLVLMLAIVISVPFLLYQAWAFIAPGLYRHEKHLAVPMLVSSTILFYLGMAFAYFVVFPLIFAFFTSSAPEGVSVMTDISRYLDFVILLFLAFGIAFEVPIATILLVAMGLTTPQQLAAKRPYIIVGVFVVGMILTPPDIISQTLLALPMWLLFEIGIVLSKVLVKKKAAREAEEGEDPPPADDPPSRPAPTEAADLSARAAAAAAKARAKAATAVARARQGRKHETDQPLSASEMDEALDQAEAEERRLRGASDNSKPQDK